MHNKKNNNSILILVIIVGLFFLTYGTNSSQHFAYNEENRMYVTPEDLEDIFEQGVATGKNEMMLNLIDNCTKAQKFIIKLNHDGKEKHPLTFGPFQCFKVGLEESTL